MDPDAVLARIRMMQTDWLLDGQDTDKNIDVVAYMDDLVAAVAALDGWMCGGGFLPRVWEASRGGGK